MGAKKDKKPAKTAGLAAWRQCPGRDRSFLLFYQSESFTLSQISERVRCVTGSSAEHMNAMRPATPAASAAAQIKAAFLSIEATESTAQVWQEPQVQPIPRSPPQVQVQSCPASAAISIADAHTERNISAATATSSILFDFCVPIPGLTVCIACFSFLLRFFTLLSHSHYSVYM